MPLTTIQIEDKHNLPFFNKQPLVIDKGEGVWVTTTENNRYLDFTSGWGVTSLGHAHPAITGALLEQSQKIMQNPNAGLTYCPARARLLEKLVPLLPSQLSRVFFTTSGAEANDAAIKLSRKITGRSTIVTTLKSFHGRTTTAYSVTGNLEKGRQFGCTDHNVKFAPFDDPAALASMLDENVAAFIVEPIQGEGGVNIPADNYLAEASKLCAENGTLFIVDEIQTGFCRTGRFFATSDMPANIDFLTMAKGLGGGFPIGGIATSESIAARLNIGDHGGTYSGNPLGCAVAAAVIDVLLEDNIATHVSRLGVLAIDELTMQLSNLPLVKDIRGVGLLLCVEFWTDDIAAQIVARCMEKGLLVTKTQGNMIRIFPALNITETELRRGLSIIVDAVIDGLAVSEKLVEDS